MSCSVASYVLNVVLVVSVCHQYIPTVKCTYQYSPKYSVSSVWLRDGLSIHSFTNIYPLQNVLTNTYLNIVLVVSPIYTHYILYNVPNIHLNIVLVVCVVDRRTATPGIDWVRRLLPNRITRSSHPISYL